MQMPPPPRESMLAIEAVAKRGNNMRQLSPNLALHHVFEHLKGFKINCGKETVLTTFEPTSGALDWAEILVDGAYGWGGTSFQRLSKIEKKRLLGAA